VGRSSRGNGGRRIKDCKTGQRSAQMPPGEKGKKFSGNEYHTTNWGNSYSDQGRKKEIFGEEKEPTRNQCVIRVPGKQPGRGKSGV